MVEVKRSSQMPESLVLRCRNRDDGERTVVRQRRVELRKLAARLPHLSFRGLHPLSRALERRGKLLDRQAQRQGAAVKAGKSVYRTALVELPDSFNKAERQGQLAKKIQYFTEHLMDHRRRSSVEPEFQGTRQPLRRAGARSATGQGKGCSPFRIRR